MVIDVWSVPDGRSGKTDNPTSRGCGGQRQRAYGDIRVAGISTGAALPSCITLQRLAVGPPARIRGVIRSRICMAARPEALGTARGSRKKNLKTKGKPSGVGHSVFAACSGPASGRPGIPRRWFYSSLLLFATYCTFFAN